MRYDAETWIRAEEMRASGSSDYEIGRRLSIPRSTVYNHFARSGRPQKQGPARLNEDGGPPGSDAAAFIVVGLFLVFLWLDRRARNGKWSRGHPRFTGLANTGSSGADPEPPPPER